MNNVKNTLKALGLTAACAVTMLSANGASAATQTRTTTITRLRHLSDGQTSVIIGGGALGGTCGAYLRVGGSGAANLISAITAALLSGRQVEVEYNDAINGSYCDLTRLSLL